MKVAIFISGRGSNMRSLIDFCENNDVAANISLVISNKEGALGLDYAKSKSIETAIVDHKKFATRQDFDQEMHKILLSQKIDFICLAGFMRLLSPWFVNKWYDKLINIHPSYLPEFKGCDAVGDAIKAGVSETGCSVHYVREEMDSGPIICQTRVLVKKNDNKESLAKRILEQEHQIYPKALKIICNNYKIVN